MKKAAFIIAQAALLNAEIALMTADNMCRGLGDARYDETSFQQLIDRYSHVLGHNACLNLLAED